MIWRRRHRRHNVEVTVLSTSDLGELLMLPLFEAIFALYWSKNDVTVNYEDLTHLAELSESADVSKSQYRRRVERRCLPKGLGSSRTW